MNDFITEFTPKKSYQIRMSTKVNADTLSKVINQDFQPVKVSDKKFSVLYVYYLVDRKIIYNESQSNVLYIGSTVGEKNGNKRTLGFRFKHLKSGRDSKQNIILSYYYNLDYRIGLDIYFVEDCRETEKQYIYDFIIRYHSQPVAQGASYSSKFAKYITKNSNNLWCKKK